MGSVIAVNWMRRIFGAAVRVFRLVQESFYKLLFNSLLFVRWDSSLEVATVHWTGWNISWIHGLIKWKLDSTLSNFVLISFFFDSSFESVFQMPPKPERNGKERETKNIKDTNHLLISLFLLTNKISKFSSSDWFLVFNVVRISIITRIMYSSRYYWSEFEKSVLPIQTN